MALENPDIKLRYTADGVEDTFPYDWLIWDEDELVVKTTSSGVWDTKVVGTDYSITNVGIDGGGNVVFETGRIPADTETVLVYNAKPYKQETEYEENDPFPAATHEEALDKITRLAQQNREKLSRSFITPIEDDLTLSEFPAAATRANKYPAFTATGDITVKSSTEIITGGDHGVLTGLSDDDHPQYHNDTRGDARYYTQTLLDAGQLDTRYYTETEIDGFDFFLTSEWTTGSGHLQTQIDGKAATSHNHAASDITSGTFDNARVAESNVTQHEAAIDHDALTNYTVGEHRTINDGGSAATDLWSADKIATEIAAASGTTNHSELDELDYASSGHTGFQPAGNYVTDSEMTTISGDIVSQIPSLSGYATEAYVTTVSGDIVAQIGDFITDAEMATISGDIVSQIPSLSGYATESYVTTVSGDIITYVDNQDTATLSSAQSYTDSASGVLDGKLTTHKSSADHDSRYYTETETNNLLNAKVDISGDTMTGSLIIQGDLTVVGSGYEAHLEQLLIESNEQYMNYGETASGVAGGWAGWWIDRGTETNYQWGFFEDDDNFQVGVSGSTQPVMTRKDSTDMTTSGVLIWNGSEYRSETFSGFTYEAGKVKVESTAVSEDNHLAPKKYVDDQDTTISGDILTYVSDNYIDNTEMTTISGDLQTNIDAKIGALSEDPSPTLSGALHTDGHNIDFEDDTISGTGTIITGDHGTATDPEVVNVIYGTGAAPTASDTTIGTLYIKYTA